MNYQLVWNKNRLLFYWLAILCVFGFVLFSLSLAGPFLMDDDHVIVHNTITKHLNPKPIYEYDPFRFLTNLSFALNYAVFGLNPVAYRAVNILIHVGNAFWVFILTRMLLRFRPKNKCYATNRWIPFLASALFLTHPLQTQAVNYIVQRSTLLCAFFYLLSLIAYIRLRITPSYVKFAVFALSACAAFYSKQTSITLLGSLILTEFYFLKSNKKLFYFIAAVLIPVLVYQTKFNFNVLHSVVYAKHADLAMIPTQYLWTQFRVITTYLRLFGIPVGQNFDYDFRISNMFAEPAVHWSFLILLILIVSAITLRNRWRYVSFGIIFFFLVLLPESSVIPLPDVIFEHRPYLALFGLILACVFFVSQMIKAEKVRGIIFMSLLLVFSGFTIHRNWIWGDAFRLMGDTVRKSPDKARVHNNLGAFYLRAHSYDQAAHEFEMALKKDSRYVEAIQNLAEVYWSKNEPGKAKRLAEQAIQIAPQFANPRVTLGHLYFSAGDYRRSEIEYREAIERNPSLSAPVNGLLSIYQLQGDLSRALQMAERSLYVNSASAISQYLSANLYMQAINLRSAVRHYERAIRLDPKLFPAYNNLANAYFRLGNYERAKKYFEKAIKLKPDFEPAYFNLANTYRELGDHEKGKEFLDRAYEFAKQNQNSDLIRKIETFYQSQSKGTDHVD